MSLTVPSPRTTPPARDRLSRLVAFYAELPDDAAALAADMLEVVARRYDAAGTAAALAPDDDEPLTDEDRAAIAEGMADAAAGRMFSLDEVMRDLGVTGAQLADARAGLEAPTVARDRDDTTAPRA